jgi:hypothetical protein
LEPETNPASNKAGRKEIKKAAKKAEIKAAKLEAKKEKKRTKLLRQEKRECKAKKRQQDKLAEENTLGDTLNKRPDGEFSPCTVNYQSALQFSHSLILSISPWKARIRCRRN